MKHITPPSVRAVWREWFDAPREIRIHGAERDRVVDVARVVRELLGDVDELEREIERLKAKARK